MTSRVLQVWPEQGVCQEVADLANAPKRPSFICRGKNARFALTVSRVDFCRNLILAYKSLPDEEKCHREFGLVGDDVVAEFDSVPTPKQFLQIREARTTAKHVLVTLGGDLFIDGSLVAPKTTLTFFEVAAILVGEHARIDFDGDAAKTREVLLEKYPELRQRLAALETFNRYYGGCSLTELQARLERYRAAADLAREFVV
jgi:hypothetical protein